MMSSSLPMVLRSQALLDAQAGAGAPATLPITAQGTTYTMAQEAVWLDATHYAVGRWDGSLSIFQFTASPTQGPLIAKAVNTPEQEGVQMITSLAPLSGFLTSNDDSSMIVWASASGAWSDLQAAATLSYSASLGVANSGSAIWLAGQCYAVVGHANGWVSIWQLGGSLANWTQVAATDVRSGHPVNPWGLTNIRGVAPLPADATYGYVVTGSEDGNLTVVRVPDGVILSAIVYNPAAQRGINSLATNGYALLVANCAVGPTDFNLWSYTITPGAWTITLTDSVNLVVDPTAAQVFNFDVIWAATASQSLQFFSSTQEGALWMGQVTLNGQFAITGYQAVTSALGSALCFQAGQLAVTAHDLYEFLV